MRVCATEQMFNFGHKIKFNFQLPRLAIVCFWPCKNCTPRRYNEAIKKFSSWPELAHLLAIRAVATLRPLSLQLPHFGASKIHLQHPELSLSISQRPAASAGFSPFPAPFSPHFRSWPFLLASSWCCHPLMSAKMSFGKCWTAAATK